MRMLTRFSSGFLLFLVAGSAGAQFDQYTTPGGPAGRPVDRKGELAKKVADARLRLGPVRVAPALELKDAEYVRNLLGSSAAGAAPSDFTATVAGGARAYLPTGPQVTWTAYALPEYVWWQKTSARRRFEGRYGGGFDGFWNRLFLEASAGSDAQQQILTPEILRLTSGRADHAGGTVELRLSGAVSTFVTGTATRYRSLARRGRDPQAGLLAQFDRDETVVRAGLRWRPASGWTVGAGAERSEVNFVDRQPGSIDRSNRGTAPVVELTREHGRLFLQADAAYRLLEAKKGSSFVKFHQPTGHAAVAWEMTRAAEVWVYANRNLVYSLLSDFSYADDQRQGAALHLKLGRRTSANLFGETGTLHYTVVFPSTQRRRDRLTSFGGALGFTLLRGTALSLQGSRTRYTSNAGGASRSFNTLGITFTLGSR